MLYINTIVINLLYQNTSEIMATVDEIHTQFLTRRVRTLRRQDDEENA